MSNAFLRLKSRFHSWSQIKISMSKLKSFSVEHTNSPSRNWYLKKKPFHRPTTHPASPLHTRHKHVARILNDRTFSPFRVEQRVKRLTPLVRWKLKTGTAFTDTHLVNDFWFSKLGEEGSFPAPFYFLIDVHYTHKIQPFGWFVCFIRKFALIKMQTTDYFLVCQWKSVLKLCMFMLASLATIKE